MRSLRYIVTDTRMLSELVKLNFSDKGQKIVFNYWKPGYYQISNERKIFHPTDSLVDAVGAVSKEIYRNQSGKFKKTASLLSIMHPGHVSLETWHDLQKNPTYLSIGTGDPINFENMSSTCSMVATDSFKADCFGFRRFPDLRVPFFSLDTKKSNLASLKILEGINQGSYNLLGDIGDKDGKNCATAVYFSLVASGVRTIIDFGNDFSLLETATNIMGVKAFIPETLASLVEKAGIIERKNAELENVYLVFESESKKERKIIEDVIEKIDPIKLDADSVVNNQKDNAPVDSPESPNSSISLKK